MKIYLDDSRNTPIGYHRSWWPGEVISLLKQNKGEIECISLDYNLEKNPESIGDTRKGMDVLFWIEEEINSNPEFILPEIIIHSRDKQMAPAMREKAIELLEMYKLSKNNVNV